MGVACFWRKWQVCKYKHLAIMEHAASQNIALPLASYEDIVKDPKLFRETLEKLHLTLGTKFMIPTIGGKHLNLHRLFIEVTSRGGINKIIQEKRWKDVTSTFGFPSTATNASFVLKKYYLSLLQNYEQIYFFKSEGLTAIPAAASTVIFPIRGHFDLDESSFEHQSSDNKRRKGIDGIPKGCPIIGVIDGKFEHGYLVTVTVGTEKLKGVLYHVPEHAPGAHVPLFLSGIHSINSTDANPEVRRRRRRRKSELRKRDPFHPKPNLSGYNFFFAEQHARLKQIHSGKDREISKIIGDLWNKLTETEKAVYQERAVKDKERYQSEMEVYKERLKSGPIVAIPIQQRFAVPGTFSTFQPAAETGSILNENMQTGSTSEESDSDEEKSAEKSMGMDASTEADSETYLGNQTKEPSVQGDGFELRIRDEDGAKMNAVEGSNLDVQANDSYEEKPAVENELP